MAHPQSKPQTAPPDLTGMLRRAAALHQSGQLREAETLYRGVLAVRPDQFDALHLLGVLKQQTGEPAEALKLIGKALASNDRSAVAHSNSRHCARRACAQRGSAGELPSRAGAQTRLRRCIV